MNRRGFLKTLGAGATALAVPAWLKSAIGSPGRKFPNIIVILADDLGYGDISIYNDESKIQTPNVDRLASEGIRFTDAHSPSSVCTPTRYGILTGRYAWRTRLKDGVFGGFNRPLIEQERMTVASMLKDHGYGTACIGKWHLGMDWTMKNEPPYVNEYQNINSIDFTEPLISGPTDLGFDYFFGTAGNPTDDPPLTFIENKTSGMPFELAPRQWDGETWITWQHEIVETTFTEKAIEFIENHVNTRPDDPFFLYQAVAAPHVPWIPPNFVIDASDAGPRGDMCVLADWVVGQINGALKRLNLESDTLLIFTSDNGPRIGENGHESAGDFRGYKSHIWEGGHREPFVVRWPGKIKPNMTSDEVICQTDLLATFAHIVGAELPSNAGEDSYNILSAMLGKKLSHPIREAIVHHSERGYFSIRQDPWKLILGTKGSGGWVDPWDDFPEPNMPGQLYNIVEDPYETTDLWNVHPEVIERLTQLLDKYKEQGHSRPMISAAGKKSKWRQYQ